MSTLILKTFTATNTGITIVVESTIALLASHLIHTDNSIVSNIDNYFLPTGVPDEYQAIIEGDYSDGIWTVDIDNGVDNLTVSIANFLAGASLLLDKTLKEKWDCVLLQQLEALRQLILANQGDIARPIYINIQRQAMSCTDLSQVPYTLEKVSIWVIDEKYIIV